MKLTLSKLQLTIITLVICHLSLATSSLAQTPPPWSMAGANSERTSWVNNDTPGLLKALWVKRLEPYVSVKTQVIGAENKVFVSTSRGVYAFDADNGNQIWVYATELPISHSPSYSNGVVYAAGLDRKIHAINASTGTKIWVYSNSASGGAGFSTSPLIAENTIFAGGRDGFMYAVDASNGSLKWKYHIEGTGPILYSAAYANGKVFFGAQDGNAYALSTTGSLVWKKKLPGAGFVSWWPVIYEDKVIFTRTAEGRKGSADPTGLPDFNDIEASVIGVGTDGMPAGQLINHTIGAQTIAVDVSINPNATTTIPNWLEANNYARNVFVLNQVSGIEVHFDIDGDGQTDAVPMLLAMQPSGNMYPPVASGFDDILYFRLPLIQSGSFAGSMAHGWEYGTRFLSVPVSSHAGQSPDWPIDEPTGIAGGGKYLYWNLCCDRFLGSVDLSQSNTAFPNLMTTRQWRHLSSGGGPGDQVEALPDNYWSQMEKFWWHGIPAAGGFGIEGDNVGPALYDGKMYVIRSNALIAFAPNGTGKSAPMSDATSPVSTGEPAGVPSVSDLTTILENEVQKIVNAGHLKPGFGVTGDFDFRAIQMYGDNLLDYWHYPGDIHYVLLRALPYLSSNLQNQVKTYLQTEFAQFPPYQYGHIGWKDGNFRESFVWPPQMASNIATRGPGNSLWENMYSWSPHQAYALWLYAKAGLGNPTTIFNGVKNKLPTTTPSVPDHFPHALNAYIAGYKGYVELAKLAGQPYATQESILNTLMSQRAVNFTTNLLNPDTGAGSEYYYVLKHAYNFMYLTPELGTYLNQNAITKVQAAVNTYTANIPLWLEAHNREVNGENSISPYQQTHALFQAKALILKEPFNQLAKNLDAPMMLGDLYYIDNLVATLDATDANTTPQPSPTSSLTPTPTPDADFDNDGTVDFDDYNALKNNFNKTNCTFSLLGDCKINIFDFNFLVSSLPGNPSATPTPSSNPTGIVAGSGIAYRDSVTVPTTDELKTMADEVINEVRTSLSGVLPQLVIVYTNSGINVNVGGNTQNVGEYIKNQLNPTARLAGEATGAEKYPPLSDGYFVAPDKRSLSAVAIAGTNLENIEMVTEQTTSSTGRNAAEYFSDSVSIGNQLGTRLLANVLSYQSKSNLLILTGPYHGDVNVVEVTNGLTQGLSDAGVDTSRIKIIGAGGTDNSGSSFNDTWQGGRSLTGVLITGSFELALSGQADFASCANGGPVSTSTTHLNNLKGELGGNPDVLFYIPGHPNTQLCSFPDAQSIMTAMRDTISQVFGTTIPTIGSIGGSEIGHYTTTGAPVGDVFHFFLAGLKSP